MERKHLHAKLEDRRDLFDVRPLAVWTTPGQSTDKVVSRIGPDGDVHPHLIQQRAKFVVVRLCKCLKSQHGNPRPSGALNLVWKFDAGTGKREHGSCRPAFGNRRRGFLDDKYLVFVPSFVFNLYDPGFPHQSPYLLNYRLRGYQIKRVSRNNWLS